MSLVPPPTPHELELLSFLSAENWQARQVALSNVAGFSAQGHPRRGLLLLDGLKPGQPDVISDLKRLTMDLPPIAHDAFSCLINLSDSILVSRRIATPDFLSFVVSYIFHPSSLLADLASMLLSNLTKLDSAAKSLVEMKIPGSSLGLGELDVAGLELLLAAFDQGATVQSSATSTALAEMKKRAAEAAKSGVKMASEDEEKEKAAEVGDVIQERKSNCHFLASVFANVTVLPSGRDFFTRPLSGSDASTLPAARLFSYTEHPDLIRRGGCISALKNVLFVRGVHSALLAPPPEGSTLDPPLVRPGAASVVLSESEHAGADSDTDTETDILPALLLPLCDAHLLSGLDDEEQLSLPDALQFLDEDKAHERDPALRAMLVESLLLLGTTLYGRRCMRERGVYVVVRELHKKEEDERIGEAILRLVNLLKREESRATMEDREEGEGEEGAEGERSKDQRAIDELIGAEEVPQKDGGDDGDDDDLVIEEL